MMTENEAISTAVALVTATRRRGPLTPETTYGMTANRDDVFEATYGVTADRDDAFAVMVALIEMVVASMSEEELQRFAQVAAAEVQT